MQNLTKKNSRKERIFSLTENKDNSSYQKKNQNRISKESETTSKKDELPSLLTANQAKKSLKYLDGWQLTDDHKTIYRDFIVPNFIAAIDLIDRIAVIAEDEKHHPDIHLTKYRNLRVVLTTHEVSGLSEKDFTIATKINALPIHTNKHDHRVTIDPPAENKEPATKKDKPVQKLQSEQKHVQTKQRPSKILASKKNAQNIKGMQTKRDFNKTHKLIKTT
ncbi:MAG: 4a-hydroxytetrahydrobiopterin dehydratase [Candidatus Omnitrophica bacterium]|nr:4a-hydroxytetrahydrobiopterin dehydratase [Candidatus Omnitrophota bacterium]